MLAPFTGLLQDVIPSTLKSLSTIESDTIGKVEAARMRVSTPQQQAE
ncbi:MAG: hypothetical protein Q8L06_19655 [Pseudohongiella sp.]|nr:hypothetical protein [Pseudohongiella sp.]